MIEPLKALLDAYEARLKPNQTLEERYRAYPDPPLEQKRLEVFQKLFEVTQAALERQTIHATQEPNVSVEMKTKSGEEVRVTSDDSKSSKKPRRKRNKKTTETK